MYAAALTLPYYHIEDVFMTGFVAKACNVQLVGVPGFHPERKDPNQVTAKDILLHYILPDAKYQIHKIVVSQLFKV